MKFSASFNGSNYLSVNNFTGNPASFSVSQWVQLNTSQTSREFFSNFLPNVNQGWTTGISDSSTNKVKFYLGSNTLTANTALTNLVWTHVVCTYDGTTAKIYLNGNTTPDATLTSAINYGTVPTSNFIGTLQGTAQWLNGSLAAMGVWSKALSTTEVTSLYNSGNGLLFANLSGTLLTSLTAYYDFSNPSNLGVDYANAHNMTNTGVLWNPNGPSGSFYPNGPIDGAAAIAGSQGGGTTFPITLTTASSNDVIVVVMYNENGNSGNPIRTITGVSGGSLAWSQRSSTSIGGASNPSNIGCWYALAASPLSAVTITVTLSGATDDYVLAAFGINGLITPPFDTNISLPNGVTANSGPLSTTINTTQFNDFIFTAVGNVATSIANLPNAGFTFLTGASTNAGSLDAGMGIWYEVVTVPQSNLAFSTTPSGTGVIMMVDALTSGGGYSTLFAYGYGV